MDRSVLRGEPARREVRIRRQVGQIANRYADRDVAGQIIRCNTRNRAGRFVSKVAYGSLRTAKEAAGKMRSVVGDMPKFVYACGDHYHLTTRPTDPRNSADREIEIPRKALESAAGKRRYLRKCGVAACLLMIAQPGVDIEELARALGWPTGRTPHGHDGRRVLGDLIDSFRQAGWIRREDDRVIVMRPDELQRLVRSAELIEV